MGETRERKPIGSETINANGYTLVKKGEGKWVGKHILVAEKKLGRPIDPNNEIVRFKDGDRTNFDPENIDVVLKAKGSLKKRLATLEAKKEDIEAEIAFLKKELGLE